MNPPLAPAHFLVGTDTGIGKTFASCALLHAARRRGVATVGMKPVAAGAEPVEGQFANADALALQAAGSVPATLAEINPYCLAEPIAPHIAASETGVTLRPQPILQALEALRRRAGWVLVEGVGGFHVPLGPDWDTADLAELLRLPVILVVGLRLGCLSHALLTVEAIARRRLALAGWIANRIDPTMLRPEENLAALTERIPAPRLGVLPFDPAADPAHAARHLRLPAPFD